MAEDSQVSCHPELCRDLTEEEGEKEEERRWKRKKEEEVKEALMDG